MNGDNFWGKLLHVFPLLTAPLVHTKFIALFAPSVWQQETPADQCRRVTSAKQVFLVVLLDAVLGLLLQPITETYVNLVLQHAGPALSSIAATIRIVLGGLSDAPLGLKLNIPVATMLSDASIFLLDVWMTYLHNVLPFLSGAVQFILKHVCPLMGVSFILTVLHDAFVVSTLYLTCFYLYSKTLYGMQHSVLMAMYRLFRGLKYNPLRHRVDSCTYSVDQLLLGTTVFTVSLFLHPTILAFHLSFALLRVMLMFVTAIVAIISGTWIAILQGIAAALLYAASSSNQKRMGMEESLSSCDCKEVNAIARYTLQDELAGQHQPCQEYQPPSVKVDRAVPPSLWAVFVRACAWTQTVATVCPDRKCVFIATSSGLPAQSHPIIM
eukprot:m.59352 g.59352  ORF g.59352 m.59352 type:complete len:382 (+) comp15690_c0_seq2:136-1281(+)